MYVNDVWVDMYVFVCVGGGWVWVCLFHKHDLLLLCSIPMAVRTVEGI